MEGDNTKIQLIRDEFRKLSNNLTSKFLQLQNLRKEIKESEKNAKLFSTDSDLENKITLEKSLHEEIKIGLEIQKRLMKSYQYELLKKGKVVGSDDSTRKELEVAIELTKGGRYKLDDTNPCWDSVKALNILLMYFETNEEFESCAIIHDRLKEL